MQAPSHLVVMKLDAVRLALPLTDVARVLRAVEVTALPQAPPVVMGIVNVQGAILAVINVRKRCGLAERPIEPGHQFVIARTPHRVVALAVDEAMVLDLPLETAIEPPGGEVLAESQFVRGVVKTALGLILVCNLAALLSPEEERAVSGALGPSGVR